VTDGGEFRHYLDLGDALVPDQPFRLKARTSAVSLLVWRSRRLASAAVAARRISQSSFPLRPLAFAPGIA
jgi:hypothetical protein